MAGPIDPGVRARFAAACAGAMRAAGAGDAAAAAGWVAAALAIGGALEPAATADDVRREVMDTLAAQSHQMDRAHAGGTVVTLAVLAFRLLARAPVGLAATLAGFAPDVGPRALVGFAHCARSARACGPSCRDARKSEGFGPKARTRGRAVGEAH